MVVMDDLMPSYQGDNLVNLLAELEIRLTGRSPTRGFHSDLADLIPHQRNYVLVINDGLGAHQLAHPSAGRLRRSQRAVLRAPFPTTTVVGLSSVATAMAPMQHGVIGFTQWIPAFQKVVNMMFWEDLVGNPVDYDPTGFLPTPNLSERLVGADVRPVIVHPPHSFMTRRSAICCTGERSDTDTRLCPTSTRHRCWIMGFPPYRGGLLFEEELMSEIRRRYDPEFKSGAVRIVLETGKPIARVARDLGLHPGTLGNWVKQQRVSQEGNGPLGEDGLAELVRLRNEVAELRMERDVLKRSVVLWVKEATR